MSRTARHRRPRRRVTPRPGRRLVRLVTAGVVAGAASVTLILAPSGAWFTNAQSVPTNSWATGTVNLAAAPAVASVNVGGLYPGGPSGYGLVTVTNTGSLSLRYAASLVSSNTAIGDEVLLEAKVQPTNGSCNAGAYPGTGTVVRASSTWNTTPIFGSSAQGAQAGDRTLAPGAVEYLCFQVTLPTTSANSSQNTSVTATFNFAAEQTANN